MYKNTKQIVILNGNYKFYESVCVQKQSVNLSFLTILLSV